MLDKLWIFPSVIFLSFYLTGRVSHVGLSCHAHVPSCQLTHNPPRAYDD